MAKQNEQLDRLFREKLEDHQEKPSMLAWERLESQLPASQSSNRGIWWAVAASASLLLVAGWFVWKNSGEIASEQLLAEDVTTTEELTSPQKSTDQTENQAEIIEEISSEGPKEVSNSETPTIEPKTNPSQNSSSPKSTLKTLPKSSSEQKPQNLIAEAEVSQPEIQINTPPIGLEINEVVLPEIQPVTILPTVAEAQSTEDEAPLYRVNIYSDGIKKGTEPDKNLITEVGKTVGKVEGLLGKVDEGFAELQDKKNSLFASLTSRKQADE
ncbi:MAG: hypothetical protein B7Z16_12625 [Algoriphagus sp. 32-45-6]|nr:MAG: hypothetical protein B7Z16_12625 [Algoriphagus sp. 32-45-6]